MSKDDAQSHLDKLSFEFVKKATGQDAGTINKLIREFTVALVTSPMMYCRQLEAEVLMLRAMLKSLQSDNDAMADKAADRLARKVSLKRDKNNANN